MKISNKMVVTLTLITSLIAISGGVGIYANQQLANSFENLEDYQIRVDAAAEASSYATRVKSQLFLYLTLGKEIDKGKYFTRLASLEEQIVILENELQSPESVEQLNFLKHFSAEISNYGDQLIEAYEQNPEQFNFEEHYNLMLDFHYSSEGARKAGVAIVNYETKNLNQQIQQAKQSATSLQTVMVIIIAFIISSALTIGITTARSIAKPIEKLTKTATQIGNGQLGVQTKIDSNNEIGKLATCVNQMSEKLKENQEQLINAEREAAIQTATWVGHDLRNPLQAIQNCTYVIKKQIENMPNSEEIHEKISPFLKNIDSSIDYAEKIVRNLKDFGTQQKPHPTRTYVNSLIKKALTQINIPENIEITEAFEQIPAINVDKDMLERIVMNLVSNSIQAMKNGGTIRITTQKSSEQVEIKVQDTGPGIPKEIINKIFEPFFTTKAKGMGVGLAICKKFVESNGGTITVKSQENKGTTFTVKLPIQKQKFI